MESSGQCNRFSLRKLVRSFQGIDGLVILERFRQPAHCFADDLRWHRWSFVSKEFVEAQVIHITFDFFLFLRVFGKEKTSKELSARSLCQIV